MKISEEPERPAWRSTSKKALRTHPSPKNKHQQPRKKTTTKNKPSRYTQHIAADANSKSQPSIARHCICRLCKNLNAKETTNKNREETRKLTQARRIEEDKINRISDKTLQEDSYKPLNLSFPIFSHSPPPLQECFSQN